jgi:hypothetical protein
VTCDLRQNFQQKEVSLSRWSCKLLLRGQGVDNTNKQSVVEVDDTETSVLN